MAAKKNRIIQECRELSLPLWQCPPFLFILMGLITIVTMIATYLLASKYTAEPEVAAMIVIIVTVLLLIIGNIIINSFKKIADAAHLKSEFISIASHQLRSPLSIIKWVAESTEKSLMKDGSVQSQNSLDTIRKTTEHMVRIVNSLLDVSRIESGTFSIRKEKINLKEVTEKLVAEFKQYADASNIKIALNAEDNLPEVIGDKDRIAMVTENLIDNAIRYSTRQNSIDVYINQKNDFLILKVKDYGIGIPKSQQHLIFQKFYRVPNSIRYQTEGTGIGLYIAKNIIESLNGKIGFESEEKKGSTFWFTLPIAK